MHDQTFAAAFGRERPPRVRRERRLTSAMAMLLTLGGLVVVAAPATAAGTGSTFAGVLQQGDATPITGATILLTDNTGTFTRTTDGVGAFSFGLLAATYQLGVNGSLPGGIGYSISATVDLATDVLGAVIVVSPSALPVAVTDQASMPVEGATVTFRGASCRDQHLPTGALLNVSASPGAPGMTEITDAAGLVGVTSLACAAGAGDASIEVAAAGYLTQTFTVHDLSGPTFAVALHRLDEVVTLSGRFTDQVGNVIASAPVKVIAQGATDPFASAVTGPDGTYSFDVPVGPYSVLFSNPPTSQATYTAGDFVTLATPTSLTTTVALVPATFAFADPAGTPIADAGVVPTGFVCGRPPTTSIGAFGINPTSPPVVSGADGTAIVEVPNCPLVSQPSRYTTYTFTVTPAFGHFAQTVAVPLVRGATAVRVTLARIGGTLTDATGTGIEAVPVDISSSVTGAHIAQPTAPDGTFSLDVVAGTYAVGASVATPGSTYSVTATIDAVQAGGTIPLSMLTSTLPVVVSDVSGVPVDGATVVLHYASCSPQAVAPGVQVGRSVTFSGAGTVATDATGTAQFPVVSCPVGAGSAQIEVSAPDFLSQTFNVQDLSGTAFPVMLHRTAETFTLAGHLVDQLGNPIAAAPVVATSSSSVTPAASTVTASDGSYSFDLPTGSYSVAFANPPTAPVSFGAFAFVQLTTRTALTTTVALVPITFTVTDPSGQPLPDTGINVVSLGCGRTGSSTPVSGFGVNTAGIPARTDANGTASVEVPRCVSLPIGVINRASYAFLATPLPGHASQTVVVTTVTGATSVSVTLPPSSSFAGTLVDGAGVGLGDIVVTMRSMVGTSRVSQTTAAAGTFRAQLTLSWVGEGPIRGCTPCRS